MMINELPNRRFDHPMLTNESASSSYGGNNTNVRFGQGKQRTTSQKKKG